MVGLALIAACSSGDAPGVRLYAGRGVENAPEAGRILVESLKERGVSLRLETGVTRLEQQSLLGVRPGSGEELDPLRAFVDRHARPDDGVVRLVVLKELVDPRSALAAGVRLEGAGFSSDATATPEKRAIITALGGSFAPLLLVDSDGLEVELLLHEFGHARGLAHDPDSQNLMHEARGTLLRDDQLQKLR